jgi:hypothetical protein
MNFNGNDNQDMGESACGAASSFGSIHVTFLDCSIDTAKEVSKIIGRN